MKWRIVASAAALVLGAISGYLFFHVGAFGDPDPDGNAQVVSWAFAGGVLLSVALLGIIWISRVPKDQ